MVRGVKQRRGLTALVVLPLVAFVAVSWVIGTDVRAARDAALEAHAGDQVGALMAVVETPTHSLQERNRASGHWGNSETRAPCRSWRSTSPVDRVITSERCANVNSARPWSCAEGERTSQRRCGATGRSGQRRQVRRVTSGVVRTDRQEA